MFCPVCHKDPAGPAWHGKQDTLCLPCADALLEQVLSMQSHRLDYTRGFFRVLADHAKDSLEIPRLQLVLPIREGVK